MRDDMAKVVTERPRRGHGNTSKKTTGQRIRSYDPDREYDEPNRLPVSPGPCWHSALCLTVRSGRRAAPRLRALRPNFSALTRRRSLAGEAATQDGGLLICRFCYSRIM